MIEELVERIDTLKSIKDGHLILSEIMSEIKERFARYL